MAAFVTALALAFVVACNLDPSDDGRSSQTAVPSNDFPGGEITYRPAATDQFGNWTGLEIHGTSVEIPLNSRWRAEIVKDPCFGDERYFVLIEDTQTGDRLRVDMAQPKVTTNAANDKAIAPVRERIALSIKGTHRVPQQVQRFGPHPTETTCAGGANDVVPTLSADEFTPPAAAITLTPAPTDPGQSPIAPRALEGTEVIEQ